MQHDMLRTIVSKWCYRGLLFITPVKCLQTHDNGTRVTRIMNWLFLSAKMVRSGTYCQGHSLVTCEQPLGRCLWSRKVGKGTIAAVKQSA